jgi:hypothetical protein
MSAMADTKSKAGALVTGGAGGFSPRSLSGGICHSRDAPYNPPATAVRQTMKKKQADHEMTASEFMALPDKEKSRIYVEVDSMSDEEIRAKSRPLTAKQRAEWKKLQKKMQEEHRRGRGRPRLGNEVAKRVSITVESSLLDRADAWARRHKLNRSELMSRSLASFIGA